MKSNTSLDAQAEETLAKMSLEDKVALCSGFDFWHTKRYEKYGISSITMSDGPHGVRLQKAEADMFGINDSLPATCFPSAVTAGATWNPELYAQEGEAIGREALSLGVQVVLGPGCNIKRDPLCGRNFEYLSEDPFVAGQMAAAFIQGQQSTGASSSVKHFAVNNQEFKRQNGDSQIDDRTLREIYLAPFEAAVKQAKPATIMCSYNKINGVHASDDQWLLTDVLRSEWGFDGLVVTDWGAMNDRIEGFRAGCDLNMPGGAAYMEQEAIDAVNNGSLSLEDVNASARRMLKLAFQAAEVPCFEAVDHDAHHDLALRIAEQGAVLLKNQDHVLPASEADMVLIGSMAKDFRYQGAGSSHINPVKLANLTDALPDVPYVPCGDDNGNVTEAELNAAINAAKNASVPVVVAGLPEIYESEGFDRETMAMPEGHIRMIEAVAAANPRAVVVLLGGSAMETPWIDKVAAVLYMGLSGQAGGQACANLLTGKANPSGKLTETWPMSYQDVPTCETFGNKNVEYREGVYMGYRYYDKADMAVRFPFGHGESYTIFEYSDLAVTPSEASVTVSNTGCRTGAEVVQLYVSAPQDGFHRPVKELKGFTRVTLNPGESTRVTIPLDDRSFALWNEGWVVPSGTYTVMVGSSSTDIRLSSTLNIQGETLCAPGWQAGSWYEAPAGKPSRESWELLMGRAMPIAPEPVKGQFTMDNTCMEMKDGCLAVKIMLKVGERIISRSLKCEIDYSDPAFRLMMMSAADCPLRMLIITADGMLSEGVVKGLLDMANGHYLRGIGHMVRGR